MMQKCWRNVARVGTVCFSMTYCKTKLNYCVCVVFCVCGLSGFKAPRRSTQTLGIYAGVKEFSMFRVNVSIKRTRNAVLEITQLSAGPTEENDSTRLP